MTLKIEELYKSYGKKNALNGVNLELEDGVYGLLGPNGAGKSTLMNIITRNLDPSSGKIFYDGEDIRDMDDKFRKILGYMPQQQKLYETFTAKRFLYYIASLKGLKKSEAKKEIENALKIVNLTDVAGSRLSSFSGGMKQRVLIAQAILGDPKVLIFDEPTAGLDPKERIRVRNLISEIALNRIVILSTHVVSDIEYIAKEVIFLKKGKVIAKNTPNNLLEEIEGKVFDIITTEDKIEEISKVYRVGNIMKIKGGVSVRVISDKKPDNLEVIASMPTLEDYYLYKFDEREIDKEPCEVTNE